MKKESENNAVKSSHYVLTAMPKGSKSTFLRTKNPNVWYNYGHMYLQKLVYTIA